MDETDKELEQTIATSGERSLRWFRFSQLAPPLRIVSGRFAFVALTMVQTQPPSAERTECLRWLLLAKDAAVRCALNAGN